MRHAIAVPALTIALIGATISGALATPADDAALAACRSNAEIAEVPQAAEIGCECAIDAMSPMSEDDKTRIAEDGFEPRSFEMVETTYPGILQAVRGCFAPYD